MKTKLIRLDKLLVDRNLVESKTLAIEFIEQGRVSVEGLRVTKTASQVSLEARVSVDEPEKQWVSRGAYKLIKALDSFIIDPFNKVCIDIGASTGGFTDVLLSRGAKKVYAVDVGYGQLAWKLRTDPRVIVLERTNARYLNSEKLINEKADIIVSDASFISLTLLLKPLESLLNQDGLMAVLVKPQFEVRKDQVGRGVVSDSELHVEVINNLVSYININTGLKLLDITFSPIKGPEGNIEFLFLLCLNKCSIMEQRDFDIKNIVSKAHFETKNDESRVLEHA